MTGARLKKTPEKIAIIRELAPTATASEISRVIGVSLVTAIKWAADEVIPLMTRSQASKKAWADPEACPQAQARDGGSMTTRDARPGQASHRAPDAPGAGRMSNQRQAADRDTLAVVFWSLVIATLFLFPPVMALAIRQFE